MKIAFFANPSDGGRYAGFCQFRADGDYSRVGFDEGERVIDVLECKTFNDAKRHGNMLGDFSENVDADPWGDELLEDGRDEVTVK